MILQLGNAGHPFGGADVPGFLGNPDDDLFIMFYQLGIWYPFFRAHSRSVGWVDANDGTNENFRESMYRPKGANPFDNF